MASPYRRLDSTPPSATLAPAPLGALYRRVSFPGHTLGHEVGLVLIGILFVILFVIVASVAKGILSLGALTLMLATPFAVYFAWRGAPIDVAFHHLGLIVERNGRSETIAWNNVRYLYRRLDFTVRPFQKRRADIGFRLVGYDDQSIEVPALVDAKLAEWVERRVSHPLIDAALASFKEGTPMRFGDLELDRDGMTIKGRGIAWSDVRDIVLDATFIRIRGVNAIAFWGSMSLEAIPHPAVLVALLRDRVRVLAPTARD